MEQISGNSLLVKEFNITLIRQTLLSLKQATKQELASTTGLSIVTANTVLKQLVGSGEVIEDALIPSKGGRPAQLFRYNLDFKQVLVIYSYVKNGQDTFSFKVKNRGGETVYEETTTFPEITLSSFELHIDRLLLEFPAISAIGFAMPGVEKDGIISSHDYQQLNEQPFTPHYQTRYHLPVLYENDVNAATIGFAKQHQLKADSCCIYLYFPEKYPPGVGIYLKNGLYKGFRHMAGEVGHLPIGVDWHTLNHYSEEEFLEAAFRLCSTLIAILNPEQVVLYGEFITKNQLLKLEERCEQVLLSPFHPTFYLSESFQLDYDTGITASTLSLLDQNPIGLSRE